MSAFKKVVAFLIKQLMSDNLKRRDFVQDVEEIKRVLAQKRNDERRQLQNKRILVQQVGTDMASLGLRPLNMTEKDWRIVQTLDRKQQIDFEDLKHKYFLTLRSNLVQLFRKQ